MSSLVLNIPSRIQLVPLVTAFAEQGARSFGLATEGALSLALAAEEVLAALSGTVLDTEWILSDWGDYLELVVKFPRVGLRLASLNLARGGEEPEELDCDQMGWLVAARTVDRFHFDLSEPRLFKLVLRQYRVFPVVAPLAETDPQPEPAVTYRSPNFQELHLFCQRALACEDSRLLPPFMSRPEQLQAMLEHGHAVVEMGFSAKGEPVAGLVARAETPRLARLFGPYLTPSTSLTATELLHRMVSRYAKTSTQGLFCESLDFAFGKAEMERLGQRVVHLPQESLTLQAGYRTLTEDEGHVVWTSPAWHEYLQERYDKLCLPRELRPLAPSREEFTQAVVSCDIQPKRSEVLLRPVLPGSDAEEVLRRHLDLFRQEGLRNILFAIDSGIPEEMHYSDALKACGFRPCYLIPNAGKGDIILLQVDFG